MSSSLLRSARRCVLPIAAAGLLFLSASQATASHRTLGRSVGNIAQAPLDLALSPLVAWTTLNRNIRDIDDTPGVRIAYYVPGYIWMTGVQFGASALRAFTGAIELLPGIVLLPFPNADLDPLYDPVERGQGLVEWENGVVDVKFGIDYQAPAY